MVLLARPDEHKRTRRAAAPGPLRSVDQPRLAAERSILVTLRSVGAALPFLVKVAVTAWFVFIVSTHVERPVQSPVHPLKRDLEPGVAVSVTAVPFA